MMVDDGNNQVVFKYILLDILKILDLMWFRCYFFITFSWNFEIR